MTTKQSLETRLIVLFSVSILLALIPCVYIIMHKSFDVLESVTLILAFLAPSTFLSYRCYFYITDVIERIGLQLDSLGNEEYNSWHLASFKGGRVNTLRRDFLKLGNKLADKRQEYLHNESFVFEFIKELDLPILVLDHHGKVYSSSNAFNTLLNTNTNNLLGKNATVLGFEFNDNRWRQTESFNLNKRYQITHHVLKRSGRNYQLLVLFSIEQQLRDNEKQVWQRLIRVLNHEVRNSLTPIYSMAQSLQEMKATGVLPTAEQMVVESNILQVIENRAQQLLAFVENYSTFSKLSPADKLVVSSTDINTRLQAIFPNIIVQQTKPLQLSVDSGQLEQALINLIKNAIEASAKGTNVHINWSLGSSNVIVEVIDSGVGIINSDNLFVPFYSTKDKGTGVGLVISRELIRNQGGELTLENRADKQGAVATIILPVIS